MLTVVLIEDDAAFSELVAETIRSSRKLRLLACYSTGEDALRYLPREKPDAALVDIKLPVMDGIECVRQIRAETPSLLTHFVMLTHHDADSLIFEAFKAGAHGYLLKEQAVSEKLCPCILEVINGGAPMTPGIARKVIRFFAHQPGPVASLSKREAQVLRLVADGLPDKQIAHKLSISFHTVRMHLRSSYEKLDVNTRAGAAMKLVRQSPLKPAR
jgi:DNA-binding NarL/FixJ family response regulator